MRRLVTLATGVMLLVGISGSTTGSATTTFTLPTRQEVAQKLLSTRGVSLTMPARIALRAFAEQAPGSSATAGTLSSSSTGGALGAPLTLGTGLPNVRVNDPGEDAHSLNQTTQSETSVAISGRRVVVGFNDLQTETVFYSAGASINGVAASTDGGQSFTDGGAVPNAPGFSNLGDPALTSDAAGNFYYSSVTVDWVNFALAIGVSKSTDGGKTWSDAVNVAAPAEARSPLSYSADKDALTAGSGGLYDTWDDFTIDPTATTYDAAFKSGLPVAHSSDGGTTWTVTYASQINQYPGGCYQQYIGAQPLVGPDGTIYVAAKLIKLCWGATGMTDQSAQVIFSSKDGGSTWTQGASNPIVASTRGFGGFALGPGQFMRNEEFPTIGFWGGALYMAWNDGGSGGNSHIKLARSTDGGQSWATSWVTSGSANEIQPALSADTSGVHVAYYELQDAAPGCSDFVGCLFGPKGGDDGSNRHALIDVLLASAADGATWSVQRVTNQSFPGVDTSPAFDPVEACFVCNAYMGDYIANVSDGTHRYLAWGDNRGIVTNWTWPNGRHDPDVYFATQ